MAVESRQSLVFAVVPINAPADACFVDPLAQRRELPFGDPELLAYRLRFQRRHHGFRAVARIRQRQEIQERLHGAGRRRAGAGDVERDDIGGREHGFDGRRVVDDVRREHQHVRRLDVRVGIEQAKQPVVQHLRLAHRRVADVDLDGVVRR